MAKIDQQVLESWILNGFEHTYASLRVAFKADATMAMQIDRTLQKLRRRGQIKFERRGREVVWFPVPYVPEGAA